MINGLSNFVNKYGVFDNLKGKYVKIKYLVLFLNFYENFRYFWCNLWILIWWYLDFKLNLYMNLFFIIICNVCIIFFILNFFLLIYWLMCLRFKINLYLFFELIVIDKGLIIKGLFVCFLIIFEINNLLIVDLIKFLCWNVDLLFFSNIVIGLVINGIK